MTREDLILAIVETVSTKRPGKLKHGQYGTAVVAAASRDHTTRKIGDNVLRSRRISGDHALRRRIAGDIASNSPNRRIRGGLAELQRKASKPVFNADRTFRKVLGPGNSARAVAKAKRAQEAVYKAAKVKRGVAKVSKLAAASLHRV